MTDRIPKAQQAQRARGTILTAAQNRFAETGYDRTTIRAVATDASIDASMVMRYYGSKEGLFAAATKIDLALPDLSRVPRERLGEAVAEHFLSKWEETESGTPLRILLSSALTGSVAAAKMVTIFRDQLTPVIAAAGADGTEKAAERAAMVATQILGFALCRYVLRLPPIVALDHDAAVGWLAPTIQSYLTEPPT